MSFMAAMAVAVPVDAHDFGTAAFLFMCSIILALISHPHPVTPQEKM